ncbi:uncharacterized protein LOC135393178 [Ornithodoros turicata]|uniref:uncharacterized protein LOC135393178 n=1 Tax=Ornithodoros turicata TaxID=34597 RepID=UPI003138B4E9
MEPHVMPKNDKTRRRLQLIRTQQGQHVYFQCPVIVNKGDVIYLPWHTHFGVSVTALYTATADNPIFTIRFIHRDNRRIFLEVQLKWDESTEWVATYPSYGTNPAAGPNIPVKRGEHILVEFNVIKFRNGTFKFSVYLNDTELGGYDLYDKLTDYTYVEVSNLSLNEFHYVALPTCPVDYVYTDRRIHRKQPWSPGGIYAGSVARINGIAEAQELSLIYKQDQKCHTLSIGRATIGASLDIVARFFSTTAMIFVSVQSSPHTYDHQAPINKGVMEIVGLKVMDFSLDTGVMSCPVPLIKVNE